MCYAPIATVSKCRTTGGFFRSLRQARDEASSVYALSQDEQIRRSIDYYDIILSALILLDQTIELRDRLSLCKEFIGQSTQVKLWRVFNVISYP